MTILRHNYVPTVLKQLEKIILNPDVTINNLNFLTNCDGIVSNKTRKGHVKKHCRLKVLRLNLVIFKRRHNKDKRIPTDSRAVQHVYTCLHAQARSRCGQL